MPSRSILRPFLAGFRRVALLATACAFLSSCGVKKDLQKAEQAVAGFHSQLDSEQYETIYAATGDEFRKVTSETDLTNLLQAVHRKLGKVRGSQRENVRVNFDAGRGEVVSLQYKTDFEGGPGTESFAWQFSGDRPLLLSYNVNSNALILK
jgi:hypothetical protein